MKVLGFMFLALVFLSSGSSLYGQQNPIPGVSGTLEGKVTDGKGIPLPGMKVFAQGTDSKREASTDLEGMYKLELPIGVYVVRAGTDCTQTFQQKDVRVNERKTTLLDITIPAYGAIGASVSIYQLIATPEKYHNRFIRVYGYYRQGEEESSLYASKDDADYFIIKNSIWLNFNIQGIKLEADNPKSEQTSISLDYFNGKYILIEGIFNKEACGHLGASSGEIRNITRVAELRRFFDGKKKL